MGLRGHGDDAALDTPLVGGETQVGQGEELVFAIDGERPRALLNTPHGCSANTEVLTVTISYERTAVEAPNGVEDFIALLNWGVGGARHLAEVDVRTGVQVSFPADHVDVGVRYQAPEEAEGVGPVDRGRFKATVGWMPKASCCCATRTFRRTTIDGGGGVADFLVPNFACAVQMFAAEIEAYLPSTTMQVFSGSTALSPIVLAVTGTDLRAALSSTGIKLPGQAHLVRFTNAAVAAIRIAPSFALGI